MVPKASWSFGSGEGHLDLIRSTARLTAARSSASALDSDCLSMSTGSSPFLKYCGRMLLRSDVNGCCCLLDGLTVGLHGALKAYER